MGTTITRIDALAARVRDLHCEIAADAARHNNLLGYLKVPELLKLREAMRARRANGGTFPDEKLKRRAIACLRLAAKRRTGGVTI